MRVWPSRAEEQSSDPSCEPPDARKKERNKRNRQPLDG